MTCTEPERGIGIVVSSKSAKDVLINTRCLHSMTGCDVFWLTRPEYFPILPRRYIKHFVDITSIEALALVSSLYFNFAYIFDSDLRGALLGKSLMHRTINFDGYRIFSGRCGVCCDDLKFGNTTIADNYIFELTHRVDDYVYTKMVSPLKRARTNGIVGIYFGSGHPSKKMPFTEYASLIESIFYNLFASAVVLFGHEENKLRSQAIIRSVKSYYVLDLVGVEGFYDVQHLAHAFNNCDIIISEDNFGLHLAIALQKPCIGIFGSTLSSDVESYDFLYKIDPIFTGSCRPCNNSECPVEDVTCWASIDVDHILKAVEHFKKARV